MSIDMLLNIIISGAFLGGIFRMATPILLASLGGLVSELAGVLNIAMEGCMLVAAFVGVVVSAYTQSVMLGVLMAVLASAIYSLILAYFHLEFNAHITLTGIAFNLLASGGTAAILFALTGDKGTSASLPSLTTITVDLSFLKDIPVIGEALANQNLMVYIAFILVYVVWFFVNRTVIGRHIVAVGQNPEAAASVGINVKRVRYIAILSSGVLTGLGGVYMSMGYLQMFQRDMIAGRGFIALAAVFLGARKPVGVLLASLVFGAANALANQLGTLRIPPQWVQMIPYAATVIALAISSINRQNRKLYKKKIDQKKVETLPI